jgi:uncharacterized protein YndB with AHSA1/START domain
MTPNTTPQARLGTIEEAGDKHILRYERRLDHPVERVWAALTEPEQLAGWLAAADELELVEGGRGRASMAEHSRPGGVEEVRRRARRSGPRHAGWHIHLDHLAEALAGRPVEWSTWTRDYMGEWAGIRDRYAATMG